LSVFDPEAKTLTVVGVFDCTPYAMAIDTSGNAWVWDNDTSQLRPANLENAVCGTGVGSPVGSDGIYGMAFAPNGTLYGVNYNDGDIGTISTADGSFTTVGTSAMGPQDNGGLTFDSSGIAWVVDELRAAEIYSADISDYAGTAELSGQLTFNGTEFYSGAIVVGPAPKLSDKLPDTGSASVALGVTGLAAAGVIALGAVMMILRRRAS
jgi:LPXTG-motif cell wall-anchored protein